jgi:hypothetical protein
MEVAMLTRRYIRLVVVAGALIALVTLGWQHPEAAMAHGPIDQQSEDFTGASQIQALEQIGQGFRPTKGGLVAVEVWLESLNETGADTITANIRSGSMGGAILGSSSRFLPQDLAGGAEWIRFDFPSVIAVTPGDVYVLELDANTASHAWRFSFLNPYPGGRAISAGIAIDNTDWAFRTYSANPMGDVDCSGVVNSVDALLVLRHSAGLGVTQGEPCTDVGSY